MSRSDLVNHPMVTGAGPQRNGWFADSGAERLNRRQANVNATFREIEGLLYGSIIPVAPREPHHSPAWAYVLVTLLVGLLTGALIAWLHR